MGINRSSVLRGPAIMTLGAATWYSKGDIVSTFEKRTFGVESSVHGSNLDERLDQIITDITLTPVGEWENLSSSYPYTATAPGTEVFSTADAVIKTIDGFTHTFKDAAVTKMPSLILSATKTLFGPMTLRALGDNNTDWSVSTKLFVEASAAFADTSLSTSNIITQPYTVSWGSVAGFTAVATTEGVTVDFETMLTEESSDTDGIYGMTFGGNKITASFQPLVTTVQQFIDALKIQGTNVARGASLNSTNAQQLNISGNGVYVRIYGATPVKGSLEYGLTTKRIGQIQFVNTRTITAGVASDWFLVGTAAPI